MRILLFLALFASCSSQIYAEESRSHPERGDSTQAPARGRTGALPQPIDNPLAPIEANQREDIQKNILAPAPAFSEISKRCVRPGDILSFSGKHLATLTNSNFAIKISDHVITLKRLSASNTLLIHQLPNDTQLQANHSYPIYSAKPKQPIDLQPTGLSIRICSFVTDTQDERLTRGHEPGELLVYADMQLAATIQQEAIRLGYSILQSYLLAGLDKTMLTISVNDQEIQDAIVNLRLRFPEAAIDLNDHYESTTSPRSYAAELISWPDTQTCNPKDYNGLSIGIIDGYIDQTHHALANQNITAKNFLKESEQPDKQHGTAIATILTGSKPSQGYQGLLPGIKIMAASILRKDEHGSTATTANIVRSVDWLLVQNVRLVNVSLSGTKANFVLKSAFGRGIKNGLIIFAAAGNNGKAAGESYPAALPGVITITAIDAASRVYRQANQGKYIDFAAPGVDIWTIDTGAQGKYRSGTSYAAPHALAVAASYLSQNKSLSRDILYDAMRTTAHDLGNSGHDNVFGWGLVKAAQHLCH